MVAASTNSLCGVALAEGYGGAMWANKSPFLAPIYDQVPSMLYKPQKHVYKQTNLIKYTFLLKLCPKYLQKEISKIHIKRKTNGTCTKNSKKTFKNYRWRRASEEAGRCPGEKSLLSNFNFSIEFRYFLLLSLPRAG